MTAGGEILRASAWFLGARIDLRDLEPEPAVALGPLTLRVASSGYEMLFRFGAVVLFGLSPGEEAEVIRRLSASVHNRFPEPEHEQQVILVDAEQNERLDLHGRILLKNTGVGRLQVVAHVLAKSCVLGYYERTVAQVFDRIEQRAEELCRGVNPARGKGEMLGEIGNVLLIQARTVGRVEVTEKPEMTWDDPELDHLYERLASEYELSDRDLALSRKLDLISRTAETYLDLVNHRQMLRVEWYIVFLILVEIVLSLHDKLS